MPTYQYVCGACHSKIEVFQSFSDDPLVTCDDCEGPLRKVFSPVGIVFKGSGFYRTDSRDATKSSVSGGSASAASDVGAGPKQRADRGTGSGSDAASPATSNSAPATSSAPSSTTNAPSRGPAT